MKPKLIIVDYEEMRALESVRALRLTQILLRLERGWTRKQHAKKACVPLDAIMRFETLRWIELNIKECALISRAIGLPPQLFMELHDRLAKNGGIRSYLAKDWTLRIVPRDIKKLKQFVRDFFEEKKISRIE